MITLPSSRRFGKPLLIFLAACLAATQASLISADDANTPEYDPGALDEPPARVWKIPGNIKAPSAEARKEKIQSGPKRAAMWRVLQENDSRTQAFAIGTWEEMAAGKLTAADFLPVSPPDLGAALGLATVYGPDTAGWFLAAGWRLHVRTTDAKRNDVTLSYESLARMGWAVGVPNDAIPAARLLWDSGAEEPMPLSEFLAKAVSEAPFADAWIVAGLADFSRVTGQALRLSPVGVPMNDSSAPGDPDRTYFSPVEATDQRALVVALVVKPSDPSNPSDSSAGPTDPARILAARFFPAAANPTAEGYLVRAHYAEFRKPLPPMDFSRPFQTIWEIPEGGNIEDLPQVANVRQALDGTFVHRAHVSVYAVDSVAPYSLYEPPELVDPTELDPGILSEQRWATATSFVGEPIYDRPRILLRKEPAEALVRVNQCLHERGFRLKIYDAYRPLSVTQRLYRLHPDPRYLAVPNVGSRHNRGAAVDATLTDLEGREIEMPSPYLTFDERSHRDAPGMTATARRNLNLLTEMMATEGFTPIQEEWWHYDAPGWERYAVMDVPLWPTEEESAAIEKTRAAARARRATQPGDPLSPAVPEEDSLRGRREP